MSLLVFACLWTASLLSLWKNCMQNAWHTQRTGLCMLISSIVQNYCPMFSQLHECWERTSFLYFFSLGHDANNKVILFFLFLYGVG